MRVAQHIVLLIFGIGGLFFGDEFGPLSGLVFDWDVMMRYEFSTAIKRYHGIVVGAFAMLPMLIIGRAFKVGELVVLVNALILAVVFYLLPFAKAGELFSLNTLMSLPPLVAPYIVGSLASLGAVSVFRKLWSLVFVGRR